MGRSKRRTTRQLKVTKQPTPRISSTQRTQRKQRIPHPTQLHTQPNVEVPTAFYNGLFCMQRLTSANYEFMLPFFHAKEWKPSLVETLDFLRQKGSPCRVKRIRCNKLGQWKPLDSAVYIALCGNHCIVIDTTSNLIFALDNAKQSQSIEETWLETLKAMGLSSPIRLYQLI